ncbi:YggT family protein [Aeromicrobium sp. YIM 150415]|uniref:YggT family protein n=1 Tax=Aeromicrobium piscarium TaxID=2590901 RepID=A0A554S9S9_9ACTN|nr:MULTISPECIES: YggT family protein [Aeromicrobium]MBM9464316.1 YggT family protein [Aeromicrobium sp. YIM 150415]TSD63083.1 YggT family protein [Aeromicrobium piscarium]
MGSTIAQIIWIILQVAIWLVIARFVVDWIQVLARQWRPSGFVAVICEVIYTVTDPPLRALRKVIPPIRLGQVMLDLSPMILIIVLVIAQGVARGLMY